jgi:hypothetical protein
MILYDLTVRFLVPYVGVYLAAIIISLIINQGILEKMVAA